ncbi:hypothetical protein CO151_02845 [bacterium CG_4_9_14_3_um_filter_65_15]|nr:MAG: hypothetical protein CO151_02845 [bacterium CG_4_9_14_3_um_filter_65_15]
MRNMHNPDPWLVAVDIDGTLLNTEVDNRLAAREIDALEAVRSAGHTLALCTGRNLNSTRHLLEQSAWYPDDLPLVLLNGAVIWGDVPRRRLVCNILEAADISTLVSLFKHFETVPMVYGTDEEDGLLRHEPRPVNEIMDRYLGNRRREMGAVEVVANLEDVSWGQALEVGTIDTRERVMALSEAIGARLGDRVKVINTRSLLGGGVYYWAEAFHGGSDKGAALKTLAAHCGIPLRRSLAMGDNFNDLDMFAAAGFSVAMADGPAEVQEKADLVVPGIAAGGAAQVLQDFAAGKLDLPS